MHVFKISLSLIITSFLIVSCNPLKQLQSEQTTAEASYSTGNYEQAYKQLSTIITKYEQNNIEIPYQLYLKAGASAAEIKNYNASVNHYNKALEDSVTTDAVKGLIAGLNHSEQYEKVSDGLIKYKEFLINKDENEYFNSTRFQNEVNKGNQENIVDAFAGLSHPNEKQSMIYIQSLDGLGKTKEAVKYCNELVEKNPDFLEAKEWKAIYYYNQAEEWYESEMAKYNKDKNYTAYIYLKRDLKKISAIFRKAKKEFEDLHQAKPQEKKYIKYLKNTYIRLEMKKEAADMDKLLK